MQLQFLDDGLGNSTSLQLETRHFILILYCQASTGANCNLPNVMEERLFILTKVNDKTRHDPVSLVSNPLRTQTNAFRQDWYTADLEMLFAT